MERHPSLIQSKKLLYFLYPKHLVHIYHYIQELLSTKAVQYVFTKIYFWSLGLSALDGRVLQVKAGFLLFWPQFYCLLFKVLLHKVMSVLFYCVRVNSPWLSHKRSQYKSRCLHKTMWGVCMYSMCVSFFTSHHRTWRTFTLPFWPQKCQWPH